mmetsp:Transcript_42049/g.106070  ORF Transcript_42049/g.106070 Transcript_42049/m.106070 type:complete len:91 (+) Transcript_42049:63-335(+)|eukprot:CAMPEP_0177675730 /NCGR_PEP_ID=MMETSP0447-20121125/27367_1 /TAXON_ID=0 /ORGANISM="Stygamoeba regulata, Strain BSH-02190019" /LENGTH=90 /DNA_ID=CAMNT_0019184157 /DNA_START=68 /DNA_END=340 /DNA_ORIENTATION=+
MASRALLAPLRCNAPPLVRTGLRRGLSSEATPHLRERVQQLEHQLDLLVLKQKQNDLGMPRVRKLQMALVGGSVLVADVVMVTASVTYFK